MRALVAACTAVALLLGGVSPAFAACCRRVVRHGCCASKQDGIERAPCCKVSPVQKAPGKEAAQPPAPRERLAAILAQSSAIPEVAKSIVFVAPMTEARLVRSRAPIPLRI